MHRRCAQYVAITAISGAILTGIACEKETGSEGITTRSDAGKSAPDLGNTNEGAQVTAKIRAVEYATGANHDSPDVDWGAIDDVDAMWRLASITKAEVGAKAFASTLAVDAAPETEPERPGYSGCEAANAPADALNELLPVLFQHVPSKEAQAHWAPLREAVSGAEFVLVTCEEAPRMIVGVRDGRVIAARESLDEALELEPADPPGDEMEPEPGGPPPASIAISSPVEGASMEYEGSKAKLPHKLTGVNTARTLRFKVKAPGHLDAEVGALPMDVLTMLQGGEPQTEFDWWVWPNAAK